MTRQRRIILEQMQAPGEHLTADQVYERVRRRLPNISLGTVYRNLDLLSRTGRIRKLSLSGAQSWYDGGMHRHYHVRCVRCGKLNDVSAALFEDLDRSADRSSDYVIIGHELEFRGICPDCRRNRQDCGADHDELGRPCFGPARNGDD